MLQIGGSLVICSEIKITNNVNFIRNSIVKYSYFRGVPGVTRDGSKIYVVLQF